MVLTADEKADISDTSRLAISYNKFAQMCQVGDQLFIGRYLVNGADQSSLYLEVCLHSMLLCLRRSLSLSLQGIQVGMYSLHGWQPN